MQLKVKHKQAIGQDPGLSFPSLPAVYFAGAKPPENVELTFWTSVKDSGNPAVLNTYLQRYPNGEFAAAARALIEHAERQLKAEAARREEERNRQEEARRAAELKRLEDEKHVREAALALERQRAAEGKDLAEAKRIEEQQRAEIVARTEELRKALDAVRLAREAATAAEQQRLAAVKAADEAKERVKTAALPTSPLPADAPRDPVALTRALQTELKRVGCDPGAVDGRWTAKTTDALSKFSRTVNVPLTTGEPTFAALKAVMEQKERVCLSACPAGEVLIGATCVAKSKSEAKGSTAAPVTPKAAIARDQKPAKSQDPGLCWTSRGGYDGLVPCDSPLATGRRIN